jgi:S-adenosylhomocysteine hydrolase
MQALSGPRDGRPNRKAAAFDHVFEAALAEFPALRDIRDRHRTDLPFQGARIGILCPIAVRNAAFVECLIAVGARVRCIARGWGGSVHFAAVTARDADTLVVVDDGRLQGPKDGFDEAHSILLWPDGGSPNLIVDYDARLARLIHRGVAFDADQPGYENDPECAEIERSLHQWRSAHSHSHSAIATNIIGLCECTAKGAAFLRQIETSGGFLFPAIDASFGSASGVAIDRDHIALDTLARFDVRLTLALIDLFQNGGSYSLTLHGLAATFPDQPGASCLPATRSAQ